jgi:TIR domain-containing protein
VPPGYDWDVFISYRRLGPVAPWVRKSLYPTLAGWLTQMVNGARVFLDDDVLGGGATPEECLKHLHRSKCLLAVWIPVYADSDWCVAEWRAMRDREESLGAGSGTHLLYPVAYTGWGDSKSNMLPILGEQRKVQPHADFRDDNCRLDPRLKPKMTARVEKIASDLASVIRSVPPWDPRFPYGVVAPVTPSPFPLPGRAA